MRGCDLFCVVGLVLALALVGCEATPGGSRVDPDPYGGGARSSSLKATALGFVTVEHGTKRLDGGELFRERGVFRHDGTIVVAAGQKPQTGHTIEVVAIYEMADRLLLVVEERAPGVAGDMLTYPHHQIRLEYDPGKPLVVDVTGDPVPQLPPS